MLILRKELVAEILRQCRKEFPSEACGILAGTGREVTKVYEMTNKEKSPVTFFMDGKEQLAAMKDMRNSNLEMLGIYHSHTASPAYPSAHDIEMAFYPDVSYVIISLKNSENPEIRSFTIRDRRIDEEEVKIE